MDRTQEMAPSERRGGKRIGGVGRARQFTHLKVWQKAHAMVLEVYRVTGGFPDEEKFGLVPQLRRAAVSIAANLAEGFNKRTRKDKANSKGVLEVNARRNRRFPWSAAACRRFRRCGFLPRATPS